MNATDLTNGILNILQWSTHDFWRVLAVVMVLKALFSWRLVVVEVKNKAKTAEKKNDAE